MTGVRGSAERPLHFGSLSGAEQLTLWAMRIWVVGLKRRQPVDGVLSAAMARAGAPDAVGLVDELMAIVGYGALRTVSIECACRSVISGDECLLLRALAMHQLGRVAEGRSVLAGLLGPTAVRCASDVMVRLAGVLSGAGIVLPAAGVDSAMAWQGLAGSPTHPESPTIH